jgi:predicted DNA-binding transcriptional regulator AlpA
VSRSTIINCATFTYKTLAAFLGRGEMSLHRDMNLGRIPAGFRVGRSQKWLKSEIQAWVEAGAPPRDEWEAVKKAAK